MIWYYDANYIKFDLILRLIYIWDLTHLSTKLERRLQRVPTSCKCQIFLNGVASETHHTVGVARDKD